MKILNGSRTSRSRFHFFAFSPSSTSRRMASGASKFRLPACAPSSRCQLIVAGFERGYGSTSRRSPALPRFFVVSRLDLFIFAWYHDKQAEGKQRTSAPALTRTMKGLIHEPRLTACIARHDELRPKSNLLDPPAASTMPRGTRPLSEPSFRWSPTFAILTTRRLAAPVRTVVRMRKNISRAMLGADGRDGHRIPENNTTRCIGDAWHRQPRAMA